MILHRSRGEEGQVYPALLLAILGGFALAVGFIGLQNLVDQTGRADSASDASALAVGKAFRDEIESQAGAPGIGGLGALGGLGGLGNLISFLQNAGGWGGADLAAQQYAEANGASLAGPVQFEGFDPVEQRVVFQVTTRQNDTVKGGNSSAQSTSSSKVAISLNGLCNGLSGISLGGGCKSPADLLDACVAPTPEPEPPPPPSATPKPSAPPPPPFEPQGFCGLNLTDLLGMQITLVN